LQTTQGVYTVRPCARILYLGNSAGAVNGQVVLEQSTSTWSVGDTIETAIDPNVDMHGFLYYFTPYTVGGTLRNAFEFENLGNTQMGYGFAVGNYGPRSWAMQTPPWLGGYYVGNAVSGVYIDSGITGTAIVDNVGNLPGRIAFNASGSSIVPDSYTSGVAIGNSCGSAPALSNGEGCLQGYPAGSFAALQYNGLIGALPTTYNGVLSTLACTSSAAITASAGATFTASGSGTNLIVSSVTGYISAGDTINGTNVVIISQSSGTTGRAGVYVTSAATTYSSASLKTLSSFIDITAITGTAAVGQLVKTALNAPLYSSTWNTTVIDGLGTGSGGTGTYQMTGPQQYLASTSMVLVGTEGMEAPVTDSTTNVLGAVISGAGSYHVSAICLNGNWIVQSTPTPSRSAANSSLQLLGYAKGVNLNVTGDTQIALTLPSGVTQWRQDSLAGYEVEGITGSFSTAQVGLYTAASQGGTALATQQAVSGITTVSPNTAGASVALTAAIGSTAIMNFAGPLYFNVGTAQGGTATANIYIWGRPQP
jgi:hypothetical protein